MKKGIYLISNGTGRYKIGKTTNIDRRFKQLNSSQASHPLELIAFLPTNDLSIETKLHQQFKSNRKYKEWFEFTDLELKKAVLPLFTQQKQKRVPWLTLFLFILIAILIAPSLAPLFSPPSEFQSDPNPLELSEPD
jgi:predicted GIY-YIG superfamily endonuclease